MTIATARFGPGAPVLVSSRHFAMIVSLPTNGQYWIAFGGTVQRTDVGTVETHILQPPTAQNLQDVARYLSAPVTSGTAMDDIVRAGMIPREQPRRDDSVESYAMREGKRMHAHDPGFGYADSGPTMSQEEALRHYLAP